MKELLSAALQCECDAQRAAVIKHFCRCDEELRKAVLGLDGDQADGENT